MLVAGQAAATGAGRAGASGSAEAAGDENPGADAQSEPAYGYVSLSPKTLIGQVQIPRQFLVMSSIVKRHIPSRT